MLNQRRISDFVSVSIRRNSPQDFCAIMRRNQRMLYPVAHSTACNRSPFKCPMMASTAWRRASSLISCQWMAQLSHLVQATAQKLVCSSCVHKKHLNSQKLHMIEYIFGSSDYRVSPQNLNVNSGCWHFLGATNYLAFPYWNILLFQTLALSEKYRKITKMF